MHHTIANRIKALPSGCVLKPLRERWPHLLGMMVQIENNRWAVVIANGSSESSATMSEVAPAVDLIFEQLGFAPYVRAKDVMLVSYTFILVEPVIAEEPQQSVTVL